MRAVALSGCMGAGKSTVGPLLAARLGIPFVDTDKLIEREAGCSVSELWRTEGEISFREREVALVKKLLSDFVPRVLALGGGTVTNRAVRHLLLDRAYLVTLTAKQETLLARLKGSAHRPLLANGNLDEKLRDLLTQRAEAYAECHLEVATDQIEPDKIVDHIAREMHRNPLVMPLGVRSYTFDVAHNAPLLLIEAIKRCKPSSLVIVTDENVQHTRVEFLDQALAPLSLPNVRVVLPPGETHKSIESVTHIWDAALNAGVDREALVVAFGGGVIGDLAGFAASTLLRGVRVLQVPTTLLSMVDASVGGKTGCDHPAGKNLIGAFHQPSGVVIDLAHLTTLPVRERTAGLAEVAKIALAADEALFCELEAKAALLAQGDLEALQPVVRAAVQNKINIVRDDEYEAPDRPAGRMLVNLGHTIGHALEAHGGYTKYLHGEAVALGLLAELKATTALGSTPSGILERTSALLARLDLPTKIDRDELLAAWPFVAADKKRSQGTLRLPTVTGIGHARVIQLPLDELQQACLCR